MAEFKCPYCDFETNAERGLKRHITVKHKEEKAKTAAPDIDNTVSLEEVAGKVEIPMHEAEQVLEDPPSVAQPESEEIFVDSPEVPEPIAPPPKELDLSVLGISEIPVGAIVKLNGDHWCKNPATNQYETFRCENIICEVSNRLVQTDPSTNLSHAYLQLVVEGGSAEWCCPEQNVFNGLVKLLHLTKPTPVPVDTTDEIVEPPEAPVVASEPVEVEPEPAPIEISNKDRRAFVEAVTEYAKARDAKSDAEKDYRLVDQATRPKIFEYLKNNGQPSGKGKDDHVMVADGFKVHWTFTPGTPGVKRDIPAIIKWCLDNGHFYALEAALNLDVWDKLVETGVVPAEVLQRVQTPVKTADTRKLLVEKIVP